jgi:hypothetical protein
MKQGKQAPKEIVKHMINFGAAPAIPSVNTSLKLTVAI